MSAAHKHTSLTTNYFITSSYVPEPDRQQLVTDTASGVASVENDRHQYVNMSTERHKYRN